MWPVAPSKCAACGKELLSRARTCSACGKTNAPLLQSMGCLLTLVSVLVGFRFPSVGVVGIMMGGVFVLLTTRPR
jgi:uncharacterized OB-fold protein